MADNRPSPFLPSLPWWEDSGERRGVSYFSWCSDKMPEESELRMGRLLWAHTSRGHMATVQETTGFSFRKQREIETMKLGVSLTFSPFYSDQALMHVEISWPHLSWVFTPQLTPATNSVRGLSPRLVLGSVKLTVHIDHHIFSVTLSPSRSLPDVLRPPLLERVVGA